MMERLTKKFTNGEAYCEEIDDVGIKGVNYPTYVGKAVDKLAEYEDLEEQGLLFRLPCQVGDTVYRINEGAKEPVIKMRVLQVHFKQLHKDRIIIRIDAINDNDMGESCYFLEDFGIKVFLTQEEAEQELKQKLKEMDGYCGGNCYECICQECEGNCAMHCLIDSNPEKIAKMDTDETHVVKCREFEQIIIQ